MTRSYKIEGMTCSGCAKTVNNLLSKVEGVKNVNVDLDKKEAAVEMDQPITTETLQSALGGVPYRISGE